MKPKTMILMGIAIVCGLGASYMTSKLLADRSGGEGDVEKVTVLVAKKNLDTGLPLKNAKDLFEIKQITKGDEPKDAIDSLDKLKDKYLKANVRKGTYVTAEDLTEQAGRLQVPDGMQAMGIKVNSESNSGGWASLPGSRVDILWTVRKNSDAETGTRRLLENVLVLAADAEAQRSNEGKAFLANVITVALTPEDCLKVTTAKENGSLTLSLRKPGDVSKSDTTKVTLDMLNKGLAGSSRPQAASGATEFEQPGEGNPAELKAPQVAGGKKSAGPTPVAELQPPPQQPAVEKEVVLKKYVVNIHEGDHIRKVVYLVDETGQVAQEPVEADRLGDLPLPPPPPQPGEAAAAQPAPQPPARPVAPGAPQIPRGVR